MSFKVKSWFPCLFKGMWCSVVCPFWPGTYLFKVKRAGSLAFFKGVWCSVVCLFWPGTYLLKVKRAGSLAYPRGCGVVLSVLSGPALIFLR